eukprot:897870_1
MNNDLMNDIPHYICTTHISEGENDKKEELYIHVMLKTENMSAPSQNRDTICAQDPSHRSIIGTNTTKSIPNNLQKAQHCDSMDEIASALQADSGTKSKKTETRIDSLRNIRLGVSKLIRGMRMLASNNSHSNQQNSNQRNRKLSVSYICFLVYIFVLYQVITSGSPHDIECH